MVQIKKNDLYNICYILFWIILSFLIVYFFERSVSPRYEQCSADSSVFEIMAYSWLDGNVPYKDLFDHKGPYLYLVNAIGLLISVKWGLYLLSGINLSLVTNILWLIGKFWLRAYQSAICVLIFLGGYICVNCGGNTTEAWSLPFCVLPLYLFCRGIQTSSVKWWYNLVYGLCFGIIAFIRINNGIIPASIILVLFITAIYEKGIKTAFIHVGVQLVGFLLATIPIIMYFWTNGAFYEMIYANYIFNFEYMIKWTSTLEADKVIPTADRILTNLEWLFPIIVLFIWCIWLLFQKTYQKIFLLMLMISSGVLIITNLNASSYLHYYITFQPLILILSVMLLSEWNKYGFKNQMITKFAMLSSLLWLILILFEPLARYCLYLGKDVFKYGVIHSEQTKDTEVNQIAEMIIRNIPQGQRDNIYNLGSFEGVSASLKLRLIPAGKYFFLQHRISKVSSKVADEMRWYHQNVTPAYIITNKENIDFNGISVHTMLDKYQLVDSTNSHYLFKLK